MKTIFALCFFALVLQLVASQTCNNALPLCSDWTCGFSTPTSFPNNTACKSCTFSDIGSRFTECENGKKSLIYYWKPPATCTPSAQVSALPAPVNGIDCAVRCGAGQFLNTTSLQCQSCPAGTFASNGIRVFDEFYTLPKGFTTRCETDYDGLTCRPWRPAGNLIDSGRNDFLFGMRSILEYNVNIVEPGSITFEYSYTNDNPDERFTFTANSFEFKFVVTNGTYRTYTLALEPGTYHFSWRIGRKYLTYRDNTARIRRITVSGLGTVDTRCTACPAGYYGDGRSTCKSCLRGTFSKEGATQCTACPQYFSSRIASSSCYELPHFICNTTDYYLEYSKCNGGSRTLSPVWIAPKICLSTDNRSVVPPEARTVNCEQSTDCKDNQVYVNGNCEYCPLNQRKSGISTCEPCPAGFGVRNTFVLDHFYNSTMHALGFTTGCFGECSSRGWRYAGDYVGSGIGNGQATTWLRVPIRAARGVNASISMDYVLSCPEGGADFNILSSQFSVLATIPCTGCTNAVKTVTFPISRSETSSSQFVFLAYRSYTQETDNIDCDRVKIHKITLVNTELGGTTSCFQCPSGTDGNHNCAPCPAGTFSDADRNCSTCAAGTFSRSGSDTCLTCPFNMNSTAGSGICSWPGPRATSSQSILGVPKVFNWDPVASWVDNRAFFIPSDPVTRYYFNLHADGDGICGSSIFCQVDSTGAVISLGDSANVTYFSDANSMGLRFSSESLRKSCNSKPYTSQINLFCDQAATQIAVQVSRNPLDTCQYFASITSRDACPPCAESDYTLYKGNCVEGQRDTRWIKKPSPDHFCVGGVKMNTTISYESCSYEITVSVQWWHVILGIGIPIIVLAAVAALIVVAVVLVKRYRNLNTRFAQLDESDRTAITADIEH